MKTGKYKRTPEMMTGKHTTTKEQRKKISIAIKKYFSDNPDARKRLSEWHYKNGRKGKECNFWKGGISQEYKEQYSSYRYKKWRMSVFERDNFTCQYCGIRGNYITAHHIKSWVKFEDLRYELGNGVTLCEECHKLTDNYGGRGLKK